MNTFAALVVAGAATSASAQTELQIIIGTDNGSDWYISAELLHPTRSIVATIADLAFTMTGTNIADFAYNSAFDSDFFGPAVVTATSNQIDFSGANTLPPLANAGGVDSSNPLAIASFTADSVDCFVINGQMTGAYTGVPFPDVFFYQYADGSAGDVPVLLHWSLCFPTPGTATAVLLGGIAAARRRR